MEEHHQHVGPAVNVIKGKRTKRQRPQSPMPFEVADPPSDPETATTTTTSTDFFSSTEEEEDMANCLILLAQGQSRISSPDDVDHPNNVINRTTANVVINNNNNNKEEENYYPDPVKFSSRRYLEASGAAGTGNKAGYYVYQCKTCDRTFPSFQALGGHRASHKKPKQGNSNSPGESHFPVPERRQLFSLLPSPSSDEERQFRKMSSLSLQLSSNNNNNKVHECSICGAEFTSGQALGGHMRRHRSTPIGSNSNANNTIQQHVPRSGAIATLSLTPLINKLDEASAERRQQQQQPDTRPRTSMKVLSLDLDLNLPASGQDQDQIPQHGQNSSDANKLQIDNSQQQKSNNNNQSSSSSINVFSAAPALVDCHY